MKGRELILVECLQLSSALHGISPFTDIPSTLWLCLRKVYEDIFKEIWFSFLENELKLYDSKVTSYNSNVFTTMSPNGLKGKKQVWCHWFGGCYWYSNYWQSNSSESEVIWQDDFKGLFYPWLSVILIWRSNTNNSKAMKYEVECECSSQTGWYASILLFLKFIEVYC